MSFRPDRRGSAMHGHALRTQGAAWPVLTAPPITPGIARAGSFPEVS
jgi:hypothetical protein